MKVPEITEEGYVATKIPGKIYVSDFGEGKIISTVVDGITEPEKVIYESSRTLIKATYISNKNQTVDLKIQKFPVRGGALQSPVDNIWIDTKNISTLADFLDFLLSANLSAVSAGRLSLDNKLELEPDLESKLISLASDEKGKRLLIKLFDEGYLTTDLDIPGLIKAGMTQRKIEERREQIDEFAMLVGKPDVKEVSEIQNCLQKIPWIFGPEYEALDVRDAGNAGIPDRRLKRIDGLSDILEIKLPGEELLRQDAKGRQYISPKLSESLGQLTGYLEYYMSEYREEHNDRTGEEIQEDSFGRYYKPKGILLIGRRLKPEECTKLAIDAKPKNIRRMLSYFHWLDVITYDDLIERALNYLTMLEK